MTARFDRVAEQPAEYMQPEPLPTIGSDVIVPAVKAAVTGGSLSACCAALLNEWQGYEGDILRFWAIAALFLSAFSWLTLQGAFDWLLWLTERNAQKDLNRDGHIGEPKAALVFVGNAARNQENAKNQAKQKEWDKFVDFVERCPRRGTTLGTWEKILGGREKYNLFRDNLIHYGFADWKSHNGDGEPNTSQGWHLLYEPDDILANFRPGWLENGE